MAGWLRWQRCSTPPGDLGLLAAYAETEDCPGVATRFKLALLHCLSCQMSSHMHEQHSRDSDDSGSEEHERDSGDGQRPPVLV